MYPLGKAASDFSSVFKTFQEMPEISRTLVSNFCQNQAEAAQLVSRRARAWLELPAELSSCRTVPELVRTQAEFAQAFWADWMATGQRIAEAWGGAARNVASAASEGRQQDLGTGTTEDVSDAFAVWEWWRTDMKGIAGRRSESGAPVRHNGTH